MKRRLLIQTWFITVAVFAQLSWCVRGYADEQVPWENPLEQGYCLTHPGIAKSNPGAELRDIQNKFKDDTINRAEILHIEGVGITSGMYSDYLDKFAAYRLMIPIERRGKYDGLDYLFAGYGTELRELIQAESVSPYNGPPKLRWGIIFFARDGSRAGAIYFDEDGEYGSINCLRAKFDRKRKLLWLFGKPNLYDWLTHNFSDVFAPGFSERFMRTE